MVASPKCIPYSWADPQRVFEAKVLWKTTIYLLIFLSYSDIASLVTLYEIVLLKYKNNPSASVFTFLLLFYDFLTCLRSYKNHKKSNIFYSNKNPAEFCQLKQGAENSGEHITQWVYYHSGCVIPTLMVHCGCSAVCICSYKHRTDAVMKSFQLICLILFWGVASPTIFSYQAVSEI